MKADAGSAWAESFAACLASILALPAEDVPVAAEDPFAGWRGWLAQRNLGLVRVAEPQTFSWPGHWIAAVADGDERSAVVMFGVPSGVLWDPRGRARTGTVSVEEAFVLAPYDLALHGPTPYRAGPSDRVGTVEAIVVAEAAEAQGRLVEQARAVAGKGLAGDRYAAGRGTFSASGGNGRELTLITAEALDELAAAGVPLDAAAARRNVVTRGIDLNALVGSRFSVGGVECVAVRLAEPCAHLEGLTAPGVLRGLVHRGGIRADILVGGEIRLGDTVRALDPL